MYFSFILKSDTVAFLAFHQAYNYKHVKIKIPIHTRTNEVRPANENAWPFSFNKRADSITPNTGFIKPNTAILEGGLYFKSKDQIV